MKINKDVDSALHVLKGAVQKVLGTKLTTSVYGEENKGRLTVECFRKPTDSQMEEIEELAFEMIQDDFPVEMFEMDRREAEEKFGNDIYDKFPIPSHITRLTLTMIEDWNINCCLGPHHSSTGEVPPISIRKWRYRESKNELEISFELG